MLWTMLSLISSGLLIAGAVESAKHAKAGFGGYAVAIAIGLLLGVFNFWATVQVAETAIDRIKHYSDRVRERCFGALYLAAVLWALLAMFIGKWVTSAALRLAF